MQNLVKRAEGKEFNPAITEDALKGIKVNKSIADPEARIIEFICDVVECLKGVGYGDFSEQNPKNTIKIIQDRLYPDHLKKGMEEVLDYQEDFKKGMQAYLTGLCKEAIGPGQPADVEPIKVNLKPGSIIFIAQARRYLME